MASHSNRVILLGAGASVEAGIPEARKIVANLLLRTRMVPRSGPPVADLLDFIWSALEQRYQRELESVRAHNARQTWRFWAEPDPPDVESLLRAVDRLSQRDSDELGAFVSAWHPKLLEFQATGRDLIDCRRALEKALTECVWLTGTGELSHLLPLLDCASMEAPLTIATLNYDNTIEQAVRVAGMRRSYGFERDGLGVNASFEVSGAEVRLIKLHGSANWRRFEGGILRHQDAPMPRHVVEIEDSEVHTWSMGARLMIFGQVQKFSAEYPFFDLYLAFRDALATAHEVLVIGYSFRDGHVNAALRYWFGSAHSRRLAIIDPAPRGESETRVRNVLRLPPPSQSAERLMIIDSVASEGITQYLRK